MAFLVLLLSAHCEAKGESLALNANFYFKLVVGIFTLKVYECVSRATNHLFKYIANALYEFIKCAYENSPLGKLIKGISECIETLVLKRGSVLVLIIKKLFAVLKLIVLIIMLIIECKTVVKPTLDMAIPCIWAYIRVLLYPAVESCWIFIKCIKNV